MRRVALLLAILTVAAAACGADEEGVDAEAPSAGSEATVEPALEDDGRGTSSVGDAPAVDPDAVFEGRADVNPTGNRVSTGVGDLDGPSIDVRLDSPARWLVPSSSAPGAPWVAVLDDGRLVRIDPIAGSVVTMDEEWGESEPVVRGSGSVEPWDLATLYPAALPDGRSVSDGERLVVLADPTDRYRHRVLGDDIEAAAIEIRSVDGGVIEARVELEIDVVEGRSALVGDVDGDGVDEILVTVSNADVGARLVLYDLAGEVVAESSPIGRGSRWRNQMAIAPVGPNGEVEIIDVRTPHLGRTVEWFRIEDGAFVRVATLGSFTSHVIGSRNLDLAIVADADGDGRLEVVAPIPELTALAVIARTDEGAEVEFTVELGRALSSNLGAVDHPDGGATYAAGTEDGLVRFWVS